MIGCLGNRALFRLSEGEGSVAEQAHVATCRDCEVRLWELEMSVAIATRVLRTGRLPDVAPRRNHLPHARLLPLASALVLAVGVAWWTIAPSPEQVRFAGTSGPVQMASISLAELSQALVAADELDTTPRPDSNVAYLQAALKGEWPCEQQGVALDPACY